jgi:peptidoglycan/xylan/chitin deacetylase (PgdA/CDA1 family)
VSIIVIVITALSYLTQPDPSFASAANPVPISKSVESATAVATITGTTNVLLNPSSTPTGLPTPTLLTWQPLPPILDNNRGLLAFGSRSEYQVALTFDLCEAEGDLAGFDAGIIRVLTDTQTPATLFLGGLWMRDHQSETQQLSNNPLFELGNHSWSHKDFSVLTSDEMEQEVLLTQQYMFNLLGYQTNLFRLPYGTYTDDTLRVINEQGLYIIQWDDVSGDPDPNITAESMTNWVLQQVQPGSIIIMHANGRGWHTAEALPTIIQSLRQQGYTLVTVSQLLNLSPYK